MTSKIEFENHFAAKVIEIQFPEGYTIQTTDDLMRLKQAWRDNLKMWHSPYTALIDLTRFSLNPDLAPKFEQLLKFFSSFFMRKIVGYHAENTEKPSVSFEVLEGYNAALERVGLVGKKPMERNIADLRQRISIENDFNAHVMEIGFLAETHFANADDVRVLQSKLRTILRLWHAPYSVLINCVNCTFAAEARAEFAKLERFLKAFFCKIIIGYAPKEAKDLYPFTTYRSRHLAAAELEHSGLQSGAVANCQTKKG